MPHYYYIIVITAHNNFRNNFIQVLASFSPSNFIVSIIFVLHSLFTNYSFFVGFHWLNLLSGIQMIKHLKSDLQISNRGCQYFCVTLLQTLQKKNQPTISCVYLTLIFLWIDYSHKNHFIIIRTKLLHSSLKPSYIPYSVVRFWGWGKNLLLWTLYNFC